MSIYDEGGCCNGWLLLVHAYDHIWRWKDIPLGERLLSCSLLDRLSLEILEEHDIGEHNA